ncbi:hypothetical protein CDL15_Pgr008783 [Punica granatum]|uniref:Uncharacterized protein n=1 Tax=Punica granatum TaxID=22663 RepID=A0A218VXI9_PUNGR|nr:hypothetical protein CDL15_Pgr008783 [Punica granatum]
MSSTRLCPLPNIKRVARITSLSKSRLETFQISDFRGRIIAPNAELRYVMMGEDSWDGRSESFIRFVDGALVKSFDQG